MENIVLNDAELAAVSGGEEVPVIPGQPDVAPQCSPFPPAVGGEVAQVPDQVSTS